MSKKRKFAAVDSAVSYTAASNQSDLIITVPSDKIDMFQGWLTKNGKSFDQFTVKKTTTNVSFKLPASEQEYFISNKPQYTTVSLNGLEVVAKPQEVVEIIHSAFEKEQQKKISDLSGKLTRAGIEESMSKLFAEGFINNIFTELNLKGTTRDILSVVAEALESNTSITSLNLSNQAIDSVDLDIIARILDSNKSINKINLSGFEFQEDDFATLARAICNNKTLKVLDLSDSNIGESLAFPTAQIIQANIVVDLNLSNNPMTNLGVHYITGALTHNNSIKTLNLCHVNIDCDGIQSVAQALSDNNTLTNLDLSFNNMADPDAAVYIAEALLNNRSLTTLNLSQTNISDAGVAHIAEALKTNSTLTSINLKHNNISVAGKVAIIEALKSNHTITEFDCDFDALVKPYILSNKAKLRDLANFIIEEIAFNGESPLDVEVEASKKTPLEKALLLKFFLKADKQLLKQYLEEENFYNTTSLFNKVNDVIKENYLSIKAVCKGGESTLASLPKDIQESIGGFLGIDEIISTLAEEAEVAPSGSSSPASEDLA